MGSTQRGIMLARVKRFIDKINTLNAVFSDLDKKINRITEILESGITPHPDQNLGCRTYAQQGEDIITLCLFESMGIDLPSYIDVGAHHPFSISNTALLYSRGCRGINIEANPNLFEEFEHHRPYDINLNIGLSDKPGILDFYMIDDFSGRNSFSKEAAEDFVKENPNFKISKTIKVPVTTINDVITTYNKGKFPDFLTIDTEGFDEKILSTIDFNSAETPKIICAETISENFCQYLKDNQYSPVIKTGNIFFVRNDLKHFLVKLKKISPIRQNL